MLLCVKTSRSPPRGRGSVALEAAEEPFQLVQAGVIDHDAALAAPPRLEMDGGAQRLGELLLQPARVGIELHAAAPGRAGRGRLLLHQALGLAHRESLLGDLVRELDLAGTRD